MSCHAARMSRFQPGYVSVDLGLRWEELLSIEKAALFGAWSRALSLACARKPLDSTLNH